MGSIGINPLLFLLLHFNTETKLKSERPKMEMKTGSEIENGSIHTEHVHNERGTNKQNKNIDIYNQET